MRVETVYICERCGKKFLQKDLALKCEASHYGLTLENYKQWNELKTRVQWHSYLAEKRRNEGTRDAFDKAIEDLTKFEEKHNLVK